MFVPKYTITNSILRNVGSIDASREIVADLPLTEEWEKKLKQQAEIETIYHGARLEGNRLSAEEISEVLSGQTGDYPEVDIQEVHNMKRVLGFLEEIVKRVGPGQPYLLTVETLFEMHRLLTHQMVSSEYSGKFRQRQVVIRSTKDGDLYYSPPPAAEVPYLIEDLINWVNSEEAKLVYPAIKAAIIHFEIYRIHPFKDASNQVGRLLALLILRLEDYGLENFLSLENYLDESSHQYHALLLSTANQKVLDVHERDLTAWIDYFVYGMAKEAYKIKELVRKLTAQLHPNDSAGLPVTLNTRQMAILEFLHKHGSMQNKDFRKIFPDYSDDTVLRELKFLKQRGFIQKIGGTKKAVYVLV